jgi:hypothetical protein
MAIQRAESASAPTAIPEDTFDLTADAERKTVDVMSKTAATPMTNMKT